MKNFDFSKMRISVDFEKGCISSLIINDTERIPSPSPIFRYSLRDRSGNDTVFTSCDAASCVVDGNKAVYSGFKHGVSAVVTLDDEAGNAAWRITLSVEDKDYFAEWVEFPLLNLPNLEKNNKKGNGGSVLFPYNEGIIISDERLRKKFGFGHQEPLYPSQGTYSVFPNMLSSQMMAYLWENDGLYIGAHDPARGVKAISYVSRRGHVTMRMRLFCGVDFGQTFKTDYPIIWAVTDGRWESSAEIYRDWFEANLPKKVTKIKDNKDIPEWYADSPLVITYPVRGWFDTDKMEPNDLFYPYTNVLPLLDEIKAITDSRLMVVLMHWEGTAPWAPPYVWPPYGSTDSFNDFLNELHRRNDMLGVYCSGFGYTLQSNLIAEYNMEKEYEERGLSEAMCMGPDGVIDSTICTFQRRGYDICPASKIGRELLAEAYKPLFESGVDYAQILDQNHGGGQYFCYSKDHGHPPAPGAWMTENMQDMLGDWNDWANGMLFGCESAAAEPFIGNILLSDNRYEVNYLTGRPVPLYTYIYHEYLRNFMGNQVCSPLPFETETLYYRIGYSFSIGDCMTLILAPDGSLMSCWGMTQFDILPDKDKILEFVAKLTRFYKDKAKKYLANGKMVAPADFNCEYIQFSYRVRKTRNRILKFIKKLISSCAKTKQNRKVFVLPAVHYSAWEADNGKTAHILVNPTEIDRVCTLDGKEITVPALDAVLIEI